jgi:uncharacterized protein YyaL (SSP411 family)
MGTTRQTSHSANETKSIKTLVFDAERWLLRSGIQNLDPSSSAFGAFNAWYDGDSKRYSYAFSEITGYGISTLLYLNNLKPEPLLIERARLAADWLMRTAWDSKYGGFQCRYDHLTGSFNNRVCSFDAGMCLPALVNLYRGTKENRYLESAIQVADWLVSSMQKDDGSFYARIDTRSGEFIDRPEKWSTQSGSYHAKIAIGLAYLFSLTNRAVYRKSAIKICDWSLSFQCPDGRFVTNRQSNETHLHPHCYSAEGLLIWGLILGKKRYIASAASALRFVKRHQLRSGGIPRTYRNEEPSSNESVDILSQAIRLWVLLSRATQRIDGKSALKKAVERLAGFSSPRRDKRSRGGFVYGHTDEGVFVDHVNSWGTMFAIQALSMYLGGNRDDIDLMCFV